MTIGLVGDTLDWFSQSGSSSSDQAMAGSSDSEHLKENLEQLSRSHGDSFPSFCDQHYAFLKRKVPGLDQRLKAFQEDPQNLPFIEGSKTRSWNEIKAACKRGEISEKEMQAWHAFRLRAKQEMEECVSLILNYFHFSPVRWQMVGTPGWDSDIDNSAVSIGQHDERSVTVAKLLFDVLWFKTYGSLSGIQADLETYTAHAGERETFLQLYTPKARQAYSSVGFLGAHIALRRAMSPSEWEKYKKEFHMAHSAQFGQKVANTYVDLMQEVERFENQSRKEILVAALAARKAKEGCKGAEKSYAKMSLDALEKEKERVGITDHEYKWAGYNVKVAKLFWIGMAIDRCDKEIHRLEVQLMAEKSSKQVHKLQEKIDAQQIEIARLSILREAMQDEGYLTQGAYLNVCVHKGGQAHLRANELVGHAMETMGTAGRRAKRRYSHTHELVESSLENAAGFFHKINLHPEDHYTALIESSKYSQRVVAAARGLVERSPTQKQIDPQFSLSLSRSHAVAMDLISLKRKKLSPNMLRNLLVRSLESQNAASRALLEHMRKVGKDAPAQDVRLFFWRTLYNYFKKDLKETGKDFDTSFQGFFEQEFSHVPDNWEALCAKLEKCFPHHSSLENGADEIFQRIQKLKSAHADEFDLMSPRNRYHYFVVQLGAASGFIAINPGTHEPLDTSMGALIASINDFHEHGYKPHAGRLFDFQRADLVKELQLDAPEESRSLRDDMVRNIQKIAIGSHLHALRLENHPFAVEVSLQ